MRSWLLVSASDAEAIRLAPDSGADALILDFTATGDTATHQMAEQARRDHAAAALHQWRSRRQANEDVPFLAVRVRGLASVGLDADLDALLPAGPAAILLSGALKGADVQHLGAKLAVREAEAGLPGGSTRIIASAADDSASVFGLGSYAGASQRLLALTWSASSLSADLGTQRSGAPVTMARSLLVCAAASASVMALDTDDPADDLADFEARCLAARSDGFSGKLALNAAQVAIIDRVFGPEPALRHRRPGG